MMTRFFRSQGLPALTLAAALSACGSPQASDDTSNLDWAASRPDTPESSRYAHLWAQDFDYQGRKGDDFIFGAQVIAVRGFVSAALSGTVEPKKVTLKLVTEAGGKRKLRVVQGTTVLMAFDVNVFNGYLEVDFASAGNDLKLRELINREGGASTDGAAEPTWRSTGAPKVLKIQQDNDTVVVDLEHNVSQLIADQTAQVTSRKTGTVTVRVFLRRQKSVPAVAANAKRTVSQGKALNIGYFGTTLTGANETAATPIQRMAAGAAVAAPQKIKFYLKDFPTEFQQTAKEAVLSWNDAFDDDPISVEIAGADVDTGDPRLNVVKWFDGTDDTIGWAGVARMIVEPDSGIVMGGHVYIDGNTLVSMYRDIVHFSETASAGGVRGLDGTIGNAGFTFDGGERPVVPYFTELSKDFDEYMQGYYKETIAHEVGHVLGLRHNFRGTTQLDAQGHSASVMDYAPRADRDKYVGPGTYDLAAIKWGYYGTRPTTRLPFCTDEDMWSSYDCNQGDFGDPVDYTIKALIQGTQVLAQKPVALSRDEMISSMEGIVENTWKLWTYRSQMPAAKKAQVEAQLPEAYDFIFSAPAASWLTGDDLAVVNANLGKLRDLANKKVKDLEGQGLIMPR
jgi:hypothetical protein